MNTATVVRVGITAVILFGVSAVWLAAQGVADQEPKDVQKPELQILQAATNDESSSSVSQLVAMVDADAQEEPEDLDVGYRIVAVYYDSEGADNTLCAAPDGLSIFLRRSPKGLMCHLLQSSQPFESEEVVKAKVTGNKIRIGDVDCGWDATTHQITLPNGRELNTDSGAIIGWSLPASPNFAYLGTTYATQAAYLKAGEKNMPKNAAEVVKRLNGKRFSLGMSVFSFSATKEGQLNCRETILGSGVPVIGERDFENVAVKPTNSAWTWQIFLDPELNADFELDARIMILRSLLENTESSVDNTEATPSNVPLPSNELLF